MSAISQDLSSAEMSAAIEANGLGVFKLWSRVPSMELHDDTPDVRWYKTPGVPSPSSFTSTSRDFRKRRISTPGSRRSWGTSRSTIAGCSVGDPYRINGAEHLLRFVFCLQNSILLEWSRGDSNPWPPPCKGGNVVRQKVLEPAKFLQMKIFSWGYFALVFRRFTWVAAQYGAQDVSLGSTHKSNSYTLVTSCRANLCAERTIRFLLTESQAELDLRLPLREVD
jgi:hypothetical protein